MPRPVERGQAGGAADVGVGVGAADHPHRGGRAVLLVVGVQDEEDVERPGDHRIAVGDVLERAEHHVQEVGREVERVVGIDERHTDEEAVGRGRQRRHLGHEPDDLLVPDLGVADGLGLGVEGRQGGDGRREDAHRMGVVVEALDEPLPHVLVDEGVVGDLVAPRLELRRWSAARRGGPDRRPRGRSSARPAGRSDSPGIAGCRTSPSSKVIELSQVAVAMNAGSKKKTSGSSLRHSLASTPPSRIGISIDSPVRLSVTLMDSGTASSLPVRPNLPERPRVLLVNARLACTRSWSQAMATITSSDPARWSDPGAPALLSYPPASIAWCGPRTSSA